MRRAVLIDEIVNRPNWRAAKNNQQQVKNCEVKFRGAEVIHKKGNYDNKKLKNKIIQGIFLI